MIPVVKRTPFTGKLIPVNCFGFGGANTHVLCEDYDLPVPDVKIANPIPRLIQVCGRTRSAVNHIINELSSKQNDFLTNNFLSLLNDFATIPYQRGMRVRGYALVTERQDRHHVQLFEAKNVKQQPFNLVFLDAAECSSALKELKKIAIFAESIRKLEATLSQVSSGLNGTNDSRSQKLLQSVAVQIGIVDVLLAVGMKADGIVGRGTGELAAAYADGCLSAEEAITAAHIVCTAEDPLAARERLNQMMIFPKKISRRFRTTGQVASGDHFADKVYGREADAGPTLLLLDSFNFEIGSSFGIREHAAEGHSFLHTTPVLNLLHSLGRMYVNGANGKVTRLYPAVTYPLPSSTATLSSLVQWNHDAHFSLSPFLIQSTNYHFQVSRDMYFHFDRRNPEDGFLFDHKIDGRVLFPATGYMMMAWSAFAMLNNVCIYDVPIEFRDVSFERATVMSHSITKLTVRVNEDNGHFTVTENDNVVVRGYVGFCRVPYRKRPAARLEPAPADLIQMESKDLYREFRIRGYDYGLYFQGINDARSDGRSGSIVWRNVVSKSVKENMVLETDEDYSRLWLRSWTTFTDAMFQLLLLSRQDTSRALFVPRRVESVICYPELFRHSVAESDKFQDSITLSEACSVTAYADPDENMVWTKGLVIKGLQTSLLKRRQQYVRHKKYFYAPDMEDITLDEPADIRRVEQYYEECTALAARLNRREMGSFVETNCDLGDPMHSLLQLLVHKFKGGGDMELDMSKDLLIGTTDDDFFYPEHLLKPHLERLVYNNVDSSGTKLDVLEFNQSNFILSRPLQSFADESLLYDQTILTYTLVHPEPSKVDTSVTSGVKEILNANTTSPDNFPQSHLVVFKCPEDGTTYDLPNLFRSFHNCTRDTGFLLIIAKDKLQSKELQQALDRFHVQQFYSTPVSELIEIAVRTGYHLISKKTLFKNLIPLTSVLLKKKLTSVTIGPHMTQIIGLSNFREWLPALHEKLEKLKEDERSRLWLIPEYEKGYRAMMSGLHGFMKSLRCEDHDRLRFLMDITIDGVADIHDPKYGDMLSKDLVYNIYAGEKVGWVQYEHLCLPRNIQDDELLLEKMQHVYLKAMKPGDLTSFAWAKGNVNDVPPEKLASVFYAPLNFRDIMFATGRLQPEAIPGIPPLVAQDSILGLEFAGKDLNGNRVMGVVPYKAIASSVYMSDPELVWPVPPQWSLEEAATVPCVYATAYYALVIRGALFRNESVLIHAGAGGVGLAALRICFAMGCKVFTTVGSPAKREYLLQEFPNLKDSEILYSRDTSFEDDILMRTGGRGVDVILNSLAEEQLQAGLRCLAPNGRFLEIGKVDFIQDNPLFAEEMDHNRSFHGILLDSLFRYADNDYFPQRVVDEKKRLKLLVMQGIADGTVRPLRRTVFDKSQVEEAFRFMSSGKHIGKVLIRIQDESEQEPPLIPAIKYTYLSPRKSYIVVGGLGGFGLEVVIWLADRGARNIVISARRGIREPYQQFCVNRLRKKGVRLVITQEPSYTTEGATKILDQAMAMAPVGGLFNTAVVYEDRLFCDMKEDMFQRVMEPKLFTTLQFDGLTREKCPELDYFVTFSSISCGRGNGGQTNYNFANAAMDSVCEQRFACGLPGLSIQWGVVGDVGIVTEKTGSTEVTLLGASSQRLHSLLEALDRFLQTKAPVCLSYVKAEKAGNSSGENVDLLRMVSRIFGIKDISSLDPFASLGSLGIDSLIAVEMKQLLERATGSSMTVKEIRDVTIATLIELSKSMSAAKTE